MGLFSLIFKLGTDNAGLNSGLSQAVTRARSAAGEMSNTFRTQIAGGLSGAFAGIASAAALTSFAKQAIATAGALQDMSDATGVGVERLQELEYTLGQGGAKLEDAKAAFKSLAKARAEALRDPGGNAAQSFGKFGIDQEQLKATTDPSELLYKISDAAKDVQIDLNSIPDLLALIGSRGDALIPAIAAGLRDGGEEARKFGQVLDQEVNEGLAEAGDKMDMLGKKASNMFAPLVKFGADFGGKVLDSMDALSSGLGDVIANFQTGGKGGIVETFMGGAMRRTEEQITEEQTRVQAKEERAERRKKQPAPDTDELVRAAKEKQTIEDRIAKKQESLRVKKLNLEDRLKELMAERDKVQEEMKLKPDDLGLRERKVDLDASIFDQTKKGSPNGQAPEDRLPTIRAKQGDALTSVGNFLGTTGGTDNTNKEQLTQLQQINQGIRGLGRNVITFN